MESPAEFVKQLSKKKKTLTEEEVRKALQKASQGDPIVKPQGEPIVKPDEADIDLKTAMRYFKVKK